MTFFSGQGFQRVVWSIADLIHLQSSSYLLPDLTLPFSNVEFSNRAINLKTIIVRYMGESRIAKQELRINRIDFSVSILDSQSSNGQLTDHLSFIAYLPLPITSPQLDIQ